MQQIRASEHDHIDFRDFEELAIVAEVMPDAVALGELLGVAAGR
jgi:hypothetical protein